VGSTQLNPRHSCDGRERPTPRRQTPVSTSTSTCPRVSTVRVVQRVVNGRSGALNPLGRQVLASSPGNPSSSQLGAELLSIRPCREPHPAALSFVRERPQGPALNSILNSIIALAMCPVAGRSRAPLLLPIQPTDYLQVPPHSEEATWPQGRLSSNSDCSGFFPKEVGGAYI
jgi:hypothetical protein